MIKLESSTFSLPLYVIDDGGTILTTGFDEDIGAKGTANAFLVAVIAVELIQLSVAFDKTSGYGCHVNPMYCKQDSTDLCWNLQL